MTCLLKNSVLWDGHRKFAPGKPWDLFKLKDPNFYGIKSLQVYKTIGGHWSWVWTTMDGTEVRPTSDPMGWPSPERAAADAVYHLREKANVAFQRVVKLFDNVA